MPCPDGVIRSWTTRWRRWFCSAVRNGLMEGGGKGGKHPVNMSEGSHPSRSCGDSNSWIRATGLVPVNTKLFILSGPQLESCCPQTLVLVISEESSCPNSTFATTPSILKWKSCSRPMTSWKQTFANAHHSSVWRHFRDSVSFSWHAICQTDCAVKCCTNNIPSANTDSLDGT